jgi:hypothetical protein
MFSIGYYWDVIKISAIVINTINFIAIFLIYRVFTKNRENKMKTEIDKETFASHFIDMRINVSHNSEQPVN